MQLRSLILICSPIPMLPYSIALSVFIKWSLRYLGSLTFHSELVSSDEVNSLRATYDRKLDDLHIPLAPLVKHNTLSILVPVPVPVPAFDFPLRTSRFYPPSTAISFDEGPPWWWS